MEENRTLLFTPLISVETRTIVEVINYAILIPPICLFGIVVNVINTIVFAKQGFQDAANISLMSLAIGDLCSLLTMLLLGNFANPLLYNLEALHFHPAEVSYLTAGTPHLFFTRISSWITAFVTLERCVCITKPLKVKEIFTPKRAVAVMILIYVFVIVAGSPMYVTTKLGWKWFPRRNRSLVGLIFRDNRMEFDGISYYINGMVLPLINFFIVTVCTIILAAKMRSKTKWREGATRSAAKGGNNVSTRDMKVIRMVTFIALIFIITYFPSVALVLAIIVAPEFNVDGRYTNIHHMIFSIFFVPETINSSINIFIYMRMSTRYKTTFDKLFRRCGKAKVSKDVTND